MSIQTRRDHDDEPGVAAAFLRWTCARAVFHRGYVLTSGIYFVVNARLSAAQIVGLGTVMAVTLTLTDIPAGAWSDTVSRKWPLVTGHGFLAAGMVLTGLVTAYPLILCTQVLWGLGWAFSGGADVAWLTDELGRPGPVARVLVARARWDLTGGGTGVIAFGLLGWAAGPCASGNRPGCRPVGDVHRRCRAHRLRRRPSDHPRSEDRNGKVATRTVPRAPQAPLIPSRGPKTTPT